MLEDLSLLERLHHGFCNAIERGGVICFGKKKARGYCLKHYERIRKHNSVDLPLKETKRCKFIDCKKPYSLGGYCRNHYQSNWAVKKRNKKSDDLSKCLVESCNNKNYVRGYCNKHYLKLKRYGNPDYKQRRNNGKNHPNVLGRGKNKKCIVPGCDITNEIPHSIVKGLCTKHYNRWRKHKSFYLPIKQELKCSVKDCSNKYMCKGFCSIHYERWKAHGDCNVVMPRGRPRSLNNRDINHASHIK